MTRKQLAQNLGISEKTYRSTLRLATDFSNPLIENIGEEMFNNMNKSLNTISKNKRIMPSYDSLFKMVMLPIDQQKEVCELITKYPRHAKNILQEYLGKYQNSSFALENCPQTLAISEH